MNLIEVHWSLFPDHPLFLGLHNFCTPLRCFTKLRDTANEYKVLYEKKRYALSLFMNFIILLSMIICEGEIA